MSKPSTTGVSRWQWRSFRCGKNPKEPALEQWRAKRSFGSELGIAEAISGGEFASGELGVGVAGWQKGCHVLSQRIRTQSRCRCACSSRRIPDPFHALFRGHLETRRRRSAESPLKADYAPPGDHGAAIRLQYGNNRTYTAG